MFDYSLPLSTGVIPIEMHDFLVHDISKANLSTSLPTTIHANAAPGDAPQPPPK